MSESGESHAYPCRLHHDVPTWVDAGAVFHIQVRVDPGNVRFLTDPAVAGSLLSSVRYYHERARWHATLCLVMPDHVHVLLSFPPDRKMSRIVGEWKHYAGRAVGIAWQGNFFDHRVRHRSELLEKYWYILRNPVVKGLCAHESDWPWVWTSFPAAENPRGARIPP